MAHYLNPKNDLTFKRVFGEHKHLCMSLLNSMLPLNKPIVGIEYQTGELIPELKILRYSIVDVRCTDADGRQFIVELWLRFLTKINESTKEVPAELLENDYIREAVGYMEIGAYTKAQLETYDKFRDAIMTERSLIDDALEAGEAKGEAKERQRMILNSHQAGLSPETISTITGLTPEEIKKIIENID